MKIKLLLSLIISLIALSASAYDFMVNGIAYNKNSDGKSVTVTYTTSTEPSGGNHSSYTSRISIPETVTYTGKTYSVTSIGGGAFSNCSSLTSVEYNAVNCVTSGSGAWFQNCPLTSLKIDDKVEKIPDYIASDLQDLTSITIPNSVTYIGIRAFKGCTGLTSITIPNSVTSIGVDAFNGCTGLTSVEYNAVNCSDTYEPPHTWFEGCTFTSLIIGDKVERIPDYIVSDQKNLTSITIPKSVTSIGNRAFYGCSGLTSITVDANNLVYDSRKNCNAIIETASNNLKTGCMNTTIPNTVTSIENYAFQGCTGLTSITIPNSVTLIGSRAFNNCSGLTGIVVDANNKTYDSRDNCNAIIETASNILILGCKNTAIPNSVTAIGEYAFYGCSRLTDVNIPKSISSIGRNAFWNCSSLMNVYSHRITPPSTGNSVFNVIPSDASLHVPGGCIDTYRQADSWKNFVNIYDDIVPTDLVTSISLNKKELVLDEWTAASEKLIATVLPDNATNKAIKWTTSNAAVATVNDGLVHGRDSGTAYIIASTADGSNLSDTCVVIVKAETILAESVTINKTELNLTTGQNEQLTATVLPDNATNKQIEWSSDNTAVATVNNEGVVAAVAPGNATITAKTTDGTNLAATCAVTVNKPEFVTGDANGDGFVRINDVVTTSNYILGDEPTGFVFAAADVNQDGFVRINDVVLIANIILDGGMNAPAKVAAMQLAGNDYMTAQGVEIKAGETRFIDIELNNDNAFSALQMDINLPDGLVLKGATLTGRADGHNLMVGRTVNGKATIAAFSTESNNIAGNYGTVIRLEVMATGNVNEDIKLDNIFASTAKGELKQLEAVSVGVNAVTGINDITVNNGPVNVYNVAGQLIRRNVNASEATHNLPAGLYLVGGKKVVVK